MRADALPPLLALRGIVPGPASYCPEHHPDVGRDRRTPGRGSGSSSKAVREVVLARAGGRCEAIVDGVRCTATLGLEAHHEVPLAMGGSNDPRTNGRGLCGRHHRIVDLALRSEAR